MPVSHRRRLLLDALHTFEAAARNASFAEAAIELNVTASGVSQQIKRLEKNMNLQLFDRSKKYPRLTPTGRRLADRLHSLFDGLHNAIDEVNEDVTQKLRISVMSAFGSAWLARRVPEFAAQHPSLDIYISSSDELVDLHTANIDLGIRFGSGNYAGMLSDLLMRIEIYPVCAPEFLSDNFPDGIEPGDLLSTVLIKDESSLRNPLLPSWKSWFNAAGVEARSARYAITFQDSHLAQEAARAGKGFAMGMSCFVEDDIRTGSLVAPFGLKLSSDFSFWLVSAENKASVRKVSSFRDWILAEAQKELQ